MRALQAELHAAQAQYVELHGRLQHGGQPDLAAHMASPPPPPPGPAAGLPMPEAEPSPERSTFGVEFGGGLFADYLSDFAGSAFSTPARPRAPPDAGQHPRSQPRSQQRTPPNTQQPAAAQQGKENASWSGNRGGPSSSARRKPSVPLGTDQEQEQAPSAARTPSGRGEWDKERSELLSLLERLQHQLSAHAEQQASPARQPTAAQEPGRAQQAAVAEQGAEAPPGTAGSPSMQPAPVHAASTPGASPPPAVAAKEPSPAATTPLSHHSSSSTGPTPRRSHFSVPRHSRSPHRPSSEQAAGEGLPDGDAGQEYFESSRGSDSSGRSSQTAAPPGRRASGINLSQAFEGACSSGRSAGSRGGSARSSAFSEGMFGCSSSIGEEGEDAGLPCSYASGLFGSSPPSAAGTRSPSPAPAPSPQPNSPGMPSSPSQLPPSPVIPPTATPFAAQPPQEGEAPAAAQATPQPEQWLQSEGLGAGGEGPAAAAATPAACQAGSGQPTPESQRLADVERRNAALEVSEAAGQGRSLLWIEPLTLGGVDQGKSKLKQGWERCTAAHHLDAITCLSAWCRRCCPWLQPPPVPTAFCVARAQAEVQRLRQLQQEAEERLSQEELRRQIDQHKQVPGLCSYGAVYWSVGSLECFQTFTLEFFSTRADLGHFSTLCSCRPATPRSSSSSMSERCRSTVLAWSSRGRLPPRRQPCCCATVPQHCTPWAGRTCRGGFGHMKWGKQASMLLAIP